MTKNSFIFTLTILLSITLGSLVGLFGGTQIQFFSLSFYPVIDLIATLFLNALLLLVVPLVFSSIVSGMIKMQREADFAKIGAKILATFLSLNFIAILTGAFFYILFQKTFTTDRLAISPEILSNMLSSPTTEAFSLVNFLKQFIPSSIGVLLSGKYIIAVILSALFFGYAIGKISEKEKNFLSTLWESIFQTTLYLTKMLMKILPLGVFALVAKQFSQTGPQALQLMSYFLLMVLLALLFYMLIPLSLILKYFAKTSPLRHLSHMFPALVTAFSTSSSAATLPVTMECLEKKAGVPNQTTSLVLPLGIALNMAGSALFVIASALFLAGIYGVPLTFSTIMLTVFVTLLASFGIAGIPSAAIVSVIIVLQVLGIPQEAIGILFAVDRICDMARTPVNTYAASCSTMIIHKSQTKGSP